MIIYESELNIKNLIENNTATSNAIFICNSNADTNEMVQACKGDACSCDLTRQVIADRASSDVTAFSSILVTDIWNANDDVFCAEEILKARETPRYKPINWMHRGSEDTKNEIVGVMVEPRVVHGSLSNLKYFTDSDIEQFSTACSSKSTVSGELHIRQDGVIWSQYFPTYAKKIEKGIKSGDLYVSMECFFEDFDYVLRDNKDSEDFMIVERNNTTAKFSKGLKSYGGKGKVSHKGKDYYIGRLLKGIVFSGQGIVKEPANTKDGNVFSIILDDSDSFNTFAQQNEQAPPPSAMTPEGGLPTDEEEAYGEPQQDERELPTTYVAPDEYLFNTSEEAQFAAENILGCSGYHVYLEDRHSEQPFLFAKLLGNPDDVEKQFMRPKFLPCENHGEFLLLSEKEGGNLGDGGGGDSGEKCSDNTDVCLTVTEGEIKYVSSSDIKSFGFTHDGCVESAGGGDAESYQFLTTVTLTSVSSTSTLRSIPAGEGQLLTLEGNIDIDIGCLSSPLFYDNEENQLTASFVSSTTAPTGGGDPAGDQPPVNMNTSRGFISSSMWTKLIKALKFNKNAQEGYNIYDSQEGITMSDKIDYKLMYEEVSKKLEGIQKTKTEQRISVLKKDNERLSLQAEEAAQAIDTATSVIETIPSMENELHELREFVSQADTVISEIESINLGTSRLNELNALVGDTYSEADISTLSEMSDEVFNHVLRSMENVVDKIEAVAEQVEKDNEEKAISQLKQEEDDFLANHASKAINKHKIKNDPDMVVRSSKKDKMSAARNLINSALQR